MKDNELITEENYVQIMREVNRIRARNYRKQHPDKHKEYCKKWTEGNREHVNEYRRKYYQEHKDKYKEYQRNYHQRKKAQADTV